MKIAAFGSEGYLNTINLIRDGFLLNGHELTLDNPDFIFCNDPQKFDEAINLKNRVRCPLILNILDIPIHIPEIKKVINEWLPKLDYADIVTSISKYTQSQVLEIFHKKSHIIYNPIRNLEIKPVCNRSNLFISVGRLNDFNKRFNLSVPVFNEFCKIFNKNHYEILNVVGSENPNYGNYIGVVNDDILSSLYSSTEIIIISSKIEGLCLPLIESMACGCIPIVCKDMTTALEFAPQELLCEPNPNSIYLKCIEVLKNKEYYRDIVNVHYSKIGHKFNKITVAENIVNIFKNEFKTQTNL